MRSRASWTGALLIALILTLSACTGNEGPDLEGSRPFTPGAAPSGETGASVQYEAPSGWVKEAPRTSFRKDQFLLPRADGDQEDGELAVFYFGPGQGGSVEANVERWIGQFQQPDGRPSTEVAETSEREVNGQAVTIVDVTGTYTASMGPMAPAGPPKPDFRMLAAIIETPSGPWFFKLTGPRRTIEKWEESFNEFVGTLRVEA